MNKGRILNRVFFGGILSFVILTANAQSSKVTSAWNYWRYKELDKAMKSIDEASKHESTINEPKTWLYRGKIYYDVYKSKKPEFMKLTADPMWEAAESFKKVLTLDEKKKDFAPEAAQLLDEISRSQYNMGADAYKNKGYTDAVNFFERYMNIGEAFGKYTGKSITDTSVMFYTGNAAYFANNLDKAKEYYKKCYDLKYRESALYLNYSGIFANAEDYTKALEILDAGMKNASDSKSIAGQRLNMLVKTGKTDQALSEGKKALETDPNNVSLYIALGTLYQSSKKEKDAEDLYLKALAKFPEDFYLNHYAGLNYYNIGVGIFEVANNLTDLKAISKKEDEAKAVWKKAIPFLEKANKLKPEDKDTRKYLAELYGRTGDLENAKKYKD